VSAHAASETITASVMVHTNPHVGSIISITGVAVTWTNNTAATSFWVQTTNNTANATTNLFTKLSLLGLTNVNSLEYSNATNILLYGILDTPLAITVSGPGGTNWATVTYYTNQSFNGYNLALPLTNNNLTTEQTNIFNDLINALNFMGSGLVINWNAPGFTNFPHNKRVSQPPLTNQPLYNPASTGLYSTNGTNDGGVFKGTADASTWIATGVPSLTRSNTFTGTNYFHQVVITNGAGIVIGASNHNPPLVNSLQIQGHGGNDASLAMLTFANDTATAAPAIRLTRYRGDLANRSNVVAGDNLGSIIWFGGRADNSSLVGIGGSLSLVPTEDWNSVSTNGALMKFQLGAEGNQNTALSLTAYKITNNADVINKSNVLNLAAVNGGATFTGTNLLVTNMTGRNWTGEIAQITNLEQKGSNWLEGVQGAAIGIITTLSGSNNVAILPTNQFVSFSGASPSVPVIASITNGFNGRVLYGYNSNGTALLIAHRSGYDGVSFNRISIPGATNAGDYITIRDGGWFIARHDHQEWKLIYPESPYAVMAAATNVTLTTVGATNATHHALVTTNTDAGFLQTLTVSPGAGLVLTNQQTNIVIAAAARTFHVTTTPMANAGVAATNLFTNYIPALRLTNNGDTAYIELAGQTMNAAATTNRFQVTYGSETTLDTGATSLFSNTVYRIYGAITRAGNTSQIVDIGIQFSGLGVGTPFFSTNFVKVTSQTNGIDTLLVLTTTSLRDGSVTNLVGRLKYDPAP
jgi:hypothetical protein